MTPADPAPDGVTLRTPRGRWTLRVRGGVPADVRADGHPVLDAVYAAVRDERWNTLPATVRRVEHLAHPGGIALLAVIDHTAPGAAAPAVTSTLTVRAGDDDGLTVALDAEIRGPLTARRIGLSVLHPLELRGRVGHAVAGGAPAEVRFTGAIAPWQPVTGMRRLACPVAAGLEARLAFDGADFEMEDHRNWCDAGWKSYAPPLSGGPPEVYAPGDHVRHTVRVTLHGRAQPPAPGDPEAGAGDGPAAPLPEFAVEADPVAEEAAVARALTAGTPLHLLLDSPGGWRRRLDALTAIAARTGTGTPDLSVTLRAADDAGAAEVAAALAGFAGLRAVAVVTGDGHVTAPGTAAAVRRVLRAHGSAAAVGGGSALHPAELNRAPEPDAGAWDLVACAVTSQAHHDDACLVLDTVRALPDVVATVRRAGGGRPVLLAPVAFRPRRSPVDRPCADDPADPREHRLGAAWLAGVAAGTAGADRVAVRLAAGPGDGGPADPVWALLRRLRGAPARSVTSDARRLTALRITAPEGDVLLLANPRATPVTARTPGGPVALADHQVRVIAPSHHTETPR